MIVRANWPGIAAGALHVARMVSTLAAFVVLSLVPWLVAGIAWLLAVEFHYTGRSVLGLVFEFAAVAIASVTAIGSLWFVGVFLVMLVKRDLGEDA